MQQLVTKPYLGAEDIAVLRLPGEPRRFPLDNAAQIFPSTLGPDQPHLFRFSATLRKPVDPVVLQSALDSTIGRFPTIAARLTRGAKWYYLEPLKQAPPLQEDTRLLAAMTHEDLGKSCFRVLYGGRGIAVEFFHAVTDGTGAAVFMKTLLAEYLEQKYGVMVPCESGVVSRDTPPRPAEIEDCYQRFTGRGGAKRDRARAYRMSGTTAETLRQTTVEADARQAVGLARTYGVTLTEFLTAVLLIVILERRAARFPKDRRDPVLISVPIDLRRHFQSASLRNFILSATPGMGFEQMGKPFQEICGLVRAHMRERLDPAHMDACASDNVRIENLAVFRILPLGLKNLVLKAAFRIYGMRTSSLTLSNLGKIELPAAMTGYVETVDFVIGATRIKTNSCAVSSCNGRLRLNFTRSIEETWLEEDMCRFLTRMGLDIQSFPR